VRFALVCKTGVRTEASALSRRGILIPLLPGKTASNGPGKSAWSASCVRPPTSASTGSAASIEKNITADGLSRGRPFNS
jgi:hypothetical protein